MNEQLEKDLREFLNKQSQSPIVITGTCGPVPANTGMPAYYTVPQQNVAWVNAAPNLTFVPVNNTTTGNTIAVYSNGNYLTTLNSSELWELKALVNNL